jgi:hypothetical protein
MKPAVQQTDVRQAVPVVTARKKKKASSVRVRLLTYEAIELRP